MRWSLFLCPILVAVAMCFPRHAAAQRPVPPPKPTFSPYLDLFRNDPGPLPNYNQFVRPKQELFRTLREQHSQLERQRASLGSLQERVTTMERQSQAGATGIGAGFMNYSHFYPARQSQSPRAARR